MSDVWPPPPEKQPEIAVPAAGIDFRFAAVASSGLFCSCLGVLMQVVVLLAFLRQRWTQLGPTPDVSLLLGLLTVFGLILAVIGGGLGYMVRRTANGVAAIINSVAALCLLSGLVLLTLLL